MLRKVYDISMKGKVKMLSPRQYAEKHGKPPSTIATWLQKKLIPEATTIETPSGAIWAIPEDAPLPVVKMGRPRKEDAKPTAMGKKGKLKARKTGKTDENQPE